MKKNVRLEVHLPFGPSCSSVRVFFEFVRVWKLHHPVIRVLLSPHPLVYSDHSEAGAYSIRYISTRKPLSVIE